MPCPGRTALGLSDESVMLPGPFHMLLLPSLHDRLAKGTGHERQAKQAELVNGDHLKCLQGAQWPASQGSEEAANAHRMALQTQALMAQLQVYGAHAPFLDLSSRQVCHAHAADAELA